MLDKIKLEFSKLNILMSLPCWIKALIIALKGDFEIYSIFGTPLVPPHPLQLLILIFLQRVILRYFGANSNKQFHHQPIEKEANEVERKFFSQPFFVFYGNFSAIVIILEIFFFDVEQYMGQSFAAFVVAHVRLHQNFFQRNEVERRLKVPHSADGIPVRTLRNQPNVLPHQFQYLKINDHFFEDIKILEIQRI
jgi:hypothetical protein